MCDVNVSILWFLDVGKITTKSPEMLDREGIRSRKELRLNLRYRDS